MFWKFAIAALGVYWVSSSFGWNPWTVAIVGGVLYGLYKLAQHQGWGGLSRPAAAHGGGISDGMKKFIVGFSTLTFVMMVGTTVVGVSNNFAFSYFLTTGPRPWLYPTASTDILIWVALFFCSVVIAAMTAHGRVKPALTIFGIVLISLFVAREMPRSAEMARPKSATPMTVPAIPAPTTKWEEADQAASEGRGIGPVAIDTAKKAVVGDKVAQRVGTEIRETVGGFFGGLLPPAPPSPAGSRTSTPVASTAPAPAKVGPTPTLYPFGTDGCYERNLRINSQWGPDRGSMKVFDPDGGSHTETFGTTPPPSIGMAGIWKFCGEGATPATGVYIRE